MLVSWRRVCQECDIRSTNHLPSCHRTCCTRARSKRQNAARRNCINADIQQVIGWVIIRIGKAKVCHCEDVVSILKRVHCVISTERFIVHTDHIDCHRIRHRVGINTAIRRAAIIAHCEVKACVTRAIFIGDRCKHQIGQITDSNDLPRRYRHT